MHTLVFTEPEYIEMDETEKNNKAAKQMNVESKVGTISATFWETKYAGLTSVKQCYSVPSVAAHDTKKFFDKPNVSSAFGEKTADIGKQGRAVNYIKKHCEITVWVQTPLVIDVLKCNYNDMKRNEEVYEEPALPVVKPEPYVKPEAIEKPSLKRSSDASESTAMPQSKFTKVIDLSIPNNTADEVFDLTDD